MAEAKLQLSAAYTAQQAFYSEYKIYSHCLTYMGFDPAPERLNRYFAIGIVTPVDVDVTAHTAAVNSGLNFLGCPRVNPGVAGSLVPTTPSAPQANQFEAGKAIGASFATVARLPVSTNCT